MNAVGQPPAPLSRSAAWKIVASVVVVVGAIGSLLYMSAKPGIEHYMHVDEALNNFDKWQGKRLQIHGFVVKDSILKRKRDALEYRFKLETKAPREASVIECEYRGLVPDNFQSGAEVVAKGTLTADHRFLVVPDGISAKCPSKYDVKTPKLNAQETLPNMAKPAPVAKTAQN